MNEYCKYMKKSCLDESRKEEISRLMREKAAPRVTDRARRNTARGRVALAFAAVALFFIGFSTASVLWLSKSHEENLSGNFSQGEGASTSAGNSTANSMVWELAYQIVIEIDGIKYVIASYDAKPEEQDAYCSELTAVLVNRSDEENYRLEGLSYPYVVVEDGQYNLYDENNRFYLYRYMDYPIEDVLAVCYTVGGDCAFWYINAEKYLNGEFDGERWRVSSKALDALREGN